MVVLSIVFGISICLIAAYTGLAIGDEESVQAFGLIWLFPLTFLSYDASALSTSLIHGQTRHRTTGRTRVRQMSLTGHGQYTVFHVESALASGPSRGRSWKSRPD